MLPQLSIGNAAITEGNGGTANLDFAVTLSSAASSNVTVNFATADGTATAGSDYAGNSGTLTISAGSTAANVTVVINGDSDPEANETFAVTLSNVSAAAALGTASALATITNDDLGPAPLGSALNDTGVTTCSNGVSNALACNSAVLGTDVFPRQDAEHGRDVIGNADADGEAGFSFIKLDANGVPLADQSVAFSVTPWDCVQDNVTGLTWEVKTDADGLRDKDWTLTWFVSIGFEDGGDQGTENGGVCVDAVNCDTEKYIAAVNAAGTCGLSDWRLPSRSELLSVIHYGVTAAPLFDSAFFPNASSEAYWSTSSEGPVAWSVDPADGNVRPLPKYNPQAVRLVSGRGKR